MSGKMTIGFIGNPNCGKTTLFNAFTGANLKVANWPGVTVEKVEGKIRKFDMDLHLVDLPGTYSLTSYTMEEIVSREFIISDEVDVVVNVVDASALERSLYLTLQLLELGKPVVMALNMMDIVEKRGMEIDLHRLPEMLGIPVIPVSARKRTGLETLLHTAVHHNVEEPHDPIIHYHEEEETGKAAVKHEKFAMVYSEDIESRLDELIRALKVEDPDIVNPRWNALKILEGDQKISEHFPKAAATVQDHLESEIINEKYDFINEVVKEVLLNKEYRDVRTERADAILTHKWLGIPVFLGIMGLVFLLTFTLGNWIKGYFEMGIEWFTDMVASGLDAVGAGEVVHSLVVDGILAGVGTILTFLPNIAILFLALAFLEDTGYMARVAYVMEGIMSKIGLSGKAFIPMLLGFGCTVPAIMASRALENERDRFKVMLVTPFMSCNARLIIYVIFAEMFFPGHELLVTYSMYILGILVAIATSAILHLIDRKKSVNYLLIELPEYKMPDMRTVLIYVWEKVRGYLIKAGTIIFLASLVLWFLLNFGTHGYGQDMTTSFGAIIGHWMVPIFAPIGLGFWQIAVALIAGISAKEVVVSSAAILFGITSTSSSTDLAMFSEKLAAVGFGPLNALCLMVFCLLYVPCAAALAAVKKESASWKSTLIIGGYQMLAAWVITFIVYRIGLLFF